MAKIPTYDNQVVSEPVQTAPVNISLFTSGGQQTRESFEQLHSVASKFNEIDILKKKTKASNDLSVELENIRTQAENDPDSDSFSKYEGLINESLARNIDKIPNGLAREQASEEFRIKAYDSFAKTRDMFRSRHIKEQQNLMIAGIDSNKKNYATAGSEEERNRLLDDTFRLIDESSAVGVISKQDADLLKSSTKKDFDYSSAAFDAQYLPDMFLKNKDKYGLDKSEKIELEAVANGNKFKIKELEIKAKKETQKNTAIRLVEQLVNTGLIMTVDDIHALAKAELISFEFESAYIKAILRPKILREERESDFGLLLKDAFSVKDIDTTINGVLKGGADGRANQEEVELLLRMSLEFNKKNEKEKMKIKQTAQHIPDDNDTAKEFAKDIIAGKEPEQAKKDAIEFHQIKTNPDRTKYSYGEPVITPRGTMYVWGHYEDGEPDVRLERPPER